MNNGRSTRGIVAEAPEEKANSINERSRKFVMEIHLDECKVMTMGGTRKLEVEVYGPELELFNAFVYICVQRLKRRNLCRRSNDSEGRSITN